jgi:hypothetical protein
MLKSLIRFAMGLAHARHLLAGLIVVLPLGFFITTAQAQPASPSLSTYACGGKLEADVWRQWDESGFAFAKGLIDNRLVATGDTYALYDIEILFHNLLAMAQRCQRVDRQLQLIKLVSKAYDQLVPAPDNKTSRAWVCRGGTVCNSTNRLVNTEVMLTSVQFLAFASSLVQGVNKHDTSASMRDFVGQTARISLDHLVRWSSLQERQALRKRIAASPGDIKDGSSALFLTDKELWQIAIYADLAGLLASQSLEAGKFGLDDAAFAALQEELTLLLRLVARRTSISTEVAADGKSTLKLADLDAGFWRRYAANRPAGYVGKDKPVVCTLDKDKPNTFKIEARINPASIAPVPKPAICCTVRKAWPLAMPDTKGSRNAPRPPMWTGMWPCALESAGHWIRTRPGATCLTRPNNSRPVSEPRWSIPSGF